MASARDTVALSLAGLLTAGLGGFACRSPDAPPPASPTPSPAATAETPPASPPLPASRERGPVRATMNSFAVYALSRGKGVPPEARETLRKVRELVEDDRRRGVSVRLESARIGLEGETRLCAEYEDAEAGAAAYERARALVAGIDLVNLVAGPCESGPRRPGQQEKEEEP